MFKMDWTHFKNYALWVAIFSFVLLVLQVFNLQVNVSAYTQITTAFLGILVLMGIVNNPSSQATVALTPEVIAFLKAVATIKLPAAAVGEHILPLATKTCEADPVVELNDLATLDK
jgi:uncharacterized membrane protein